MYHTVILNEAIGQNLEAEANFWRLRLRPRPKMKKYQINND